MLHSWPAGCEPGWHVLDSAGGQACVDFYEWQRHVPYVGPELLVSYVFVDRFGVSGPSAEATCCILLGLLRSCWQGFLWEVPCVPAEDGCRQISAWGHNQGPAPHCSVSVACGVAARGALSSRTGSGCCGSPITQPGSELCSTELPLGMLIAMLIQMQGGGQGLHCNTQMTHGDIALTHVCCSAPAILCYFKMEVTQ
jgi:hypothetical protein